MVSRNSSNRIVTFAFLALCIFLANIIWMQTKVHKYGENFDASGVVRVEPQTIIVENRINGTVEMISQIPSQSMPPRGLFFIAHACTHSAKDFWISSPQCHDCVGLSEEVRIVQKALSKNYIVVAISSSDRISGCWSGPDVAGVRQGLNLLSRRHNLSRPHNPTIAFGASSGGSFVWGQVLRHDVDAAIIQIMSVPTARYAGGVPVVLGAMPRDGLTAQAMKRNFDEMRSQHPRLVQYQECVPLAVDAQYLASRVPGLSTRVAAFVVEVLLKYHHIAPRASGSQSATRAKAAAAVTMGGGDELYFVKDPTVSNWREHLVAEAEAKGKGANTTTSSSPLLAGVVLTRGRSPLAKSFHRAWAFHEYCSDGLENTIDWLEARILL